MIIEEKESRFFLVGMHGNISFVKDSESGEEQLRKSLCPRSSWYERKALLEECELFCDPSIRQTASSFFYLYHSLDTNALSWSLVGDAPNSNLEEYLRTLRVEDGLLLDKVGQSSVALQLVLAVKYLHEHVCPACYNECSCSLIFCS